MDFTRRDVIRIGALALGTAAVGVATVGSLASCTSTPEPTKTTHRPTASAAATPDPGPTAPATVASYGPNGTHYPAGVPWLGAKAAKEVVVDCSWTAIYAALKTLKPHEVEAGVALRIKPGVLIGAGAGSSRPPVLGGIGSQDGTGQVLLCPRDGWGTVKIQQQGIRIDDCHGLAIFGIDGSTVDIYATNCSRLSLGWSVWSGMSFTRGGGDIGLYEIVLGFRRSEEDTFSIRPTDGLDMTDFSRYGCVFGPTRKPSTSGAHNDTQQLQGTQTGAFGPYISTDCIDIASSNSALQSTAQLSRIEYHNSLILGGYLPYQLYPPQSGDYIGESNAFSGGCLDVRIFDSIVNGPVGRTSFTQVDGSRIGYEVQASQEPSQSGSWTVDPGIASWTAQDIDSLVGHTVSATGFIPVWTW